MTNSDSSVKRATTFLSDVQIKTNFSLNLHLEQLHPSCLLFKSIRQMDIAGIGIRQSEESNSEHVFGSTNDRMVFFPAWGIILVIYSPVMQLFKLLEKCLIRKKKQPVIFTQTIFWLFNILSGEICFGNAI